MLIELSLCYVNSHAKWKPSILGGQKYIISS